jgi:hypothetical protein
LKKITWQVGNIFSSLGRIHLKNREFEIRKYSFEKMLSKHQKYHSSSKFELFKNTMIIVSWSISFLDQHKILDFYHQIGPILRRKSLFSLFAVGFFWQNNCLFLKSFKCLSRSKHA